MRSTKGSEKKPDDDKKTTPPPSNPNDSEKKGMSGIGIFFTIVFVLAAVYFVGGAFYNFKMYNARGLDLIPHRGKYYNWTMIGKCGCLICIMPILQNFGLISLISSE